MSELPQQKIDSDPDDVDVLEKPISPPELIDNVETFSENSPETTDSLTGEKAKVLSNLNTATIALMGELENIPELSEAENRYVSEQLEEKGLSKKLVEKLGNMMHAQEHAAQKIKDKYDPRVIRAVGAVGKIAGGVTGLTAGMAAGGLAGGAVGAIGGSKSAGYGAIKALEGLAEKLPKGLREKIMIQNIRTSEQEDAESITESEQVAESIQEQSEHNVETMKRISEKIEKINALPYAARKKVWERFLSNEKTQHLAEQINMKASKHKEFWHAFEKRHPHAAIGLELTTHMGIPLATKGMLDPVIVEKIILGVEYALSAGVSEKITATVTAELHSARDHLVGLKEKFQQLQESFTSKK